MSAGPPAASKPGVLLRRYGTFLAMVAVIAVVLELLPSARSATPHSTPRSSELASVTPAPVPGTPGITVGGVACASGVRQVPWSNYAPICMPRWSGSNGGATAPGVSSRTITLTYRNAESTALAALSSEVGPSLLPTNATVVSVMNAYISLFNRTYELYGRHVVLKAFTGQGDFLQEDLGGDQAQAQADAATAASLGAFADISVLASTEPYDAALADHHVIAIGAQFLPKSWFSEYAPYEYSVIPDCNKEATTTAAVVGRSMAHLPAIFAGSTAMQKKTRVFGLLYPSSPLYAQCAEQAARLLKDRYGVSLAAQVSYALSLTSINNQASTAIAEMKAAGVTTVLCACDPITPLYLSAAANSQGYHPEWLTLSLDDALSRLPAQNQWAHAISGGFVSIPPTAQEAYRAYLLADGGSKPSLPVSETLAAFYEPLLFFFDALQQAGPDLTPQTFEQGVDSLPPSLPGAQFGAWRFGPGTYDPAADFQIMWWSPTATSAQDQRKGAWQPCNGGERYYYANNAATLPKGKQLSCFGSSG